MIELLGIPIGIITSVQDIRMKKINILYTLPAFLIAFIIYKPAAVLFWITVAFIMGKIMELGKAWRPGDTLLLVAYSALTLKPVLILAISLLTFYIAKLVALRGERKVPFAPFLFVGFLGGLAL